MTLTIETNMQKEIEKILTVNGYHFVDGHIDDLDGYVTTFKKESYNGRTYQYTMTESVYDTTTTADEINLDDIPF